jgi:diaminohydroxyphosphoribosylaminopyrimidine deaminase / 5-amino-6-(5-phosphoribosylamino)uracil reductase
MRRCFELAKLGRSHVAPNPMVGSVIVLQDQIIGEGFHQEWGKAHAEVNAIGAVRNKDLLKHATLYVNLEPCAHHGKTPPCADLIVSMGIPKVVISTIDSFSEVAGKGIQRMRNHGIEVITGVLENEGRWLNRRFFTFHEKKRPYLILKWAETLDGFIDIHREGVETRPMWITNQFSKVLVHKWRTEEAAILVGTVTAELDNPQLSARMWNGPQPLRIVTDQYLRLPRHLHLFDHQIPTIVFTAQDAQDEENLRFIRLDYSKDTLPQMMEVLHGLDIQSLIIEGGSLLLSGFIAAGLWDEARIFSGNKLFGDGIKAPEIGVLPDRQEQIGDSKLSWYYPVK